MQEQFVGLIKAHYVYRVEPPNTELVTISYVDQRMGGPSTRVHQRFELPPAVTEGVCVCGVHACVHVCIHVCIGV